MPLTFVEELWATWIVVAFIALSFASALIGIAYMFGSLLMNDKIKLWVKMELAEVIYSALLIAILLGSIGFIDGIAQAALGVGTAGASTIAWMKTESGWKAVDICSAAVTNDKYSVYSGVSACHMRLGIYFLHEIFEETSFFAYKIYSKYMWSSTAADFTINIEFLTEAAGFFTFNPWRGFLTMGNTVKAQVFEYAMKLMLVLKFQEVMLRFVNNAAFPVLFVVGAVLRTFIFTRRLGGLLIALALVLYFIFPMFYAFAGLVVIDIKNKVRPLWCSDTELNPRGCDEGLFTTGRPDPPIADTLILAGKVPVIQGSEDSTAATSPGSGSNIVAKKEHGLLESSTALDEYEKIKAMDSAKWETVKTTGTDSNSKETRYMPSFNLFNNQMGKMSEEEQKKSMGKIKAAADEYVHGMSRRNWVDTFVFADAFYPGGPLDILGRLAFFSVFFAFFAVLSSIAAIRSLSVTFGGDIEIAGLTRLI